MEKRIGMIVVILAALSLAACGGSSSNASNEGGSDVSPATDTRTMSGQIQTAAAMVVGASKVAADAAGTCTDFDPPICRVIATATDGTTVLDESLADCAFSLALTIGNDYIISFVGTNPVSGECDTFVATLLAGSGSLFNIGDGGAIDLGFIAIDPDSNTATFSGDFGDVIGCTEMGFDDRDDDGACDGWDGDFPDDPTDFETTECTDDSNCAEGETCTEFGFCSGEGSSDEGGEEPPVEYTIADIAGTYDAVSQVGDASCDNTYDSLPHKEIVSSPTGNNVDLTGEADGGVCWHDMVTVTLAAITGGFEATDVALDDCGGCPLYDNKSTFTFDTSKTLITLTRIITWTGGMDLKVGCGVVYEKE